MKPLFNIDDHPEYSAYAQAWHDEASPIYYAPKPLLERLKSGEIDVGIIEANNQKVYEALFQRTPDWDVLRELLTPPISVNPHFVTDPNLREYQGTYTGSTVMMKMLADDESHPYLRQLVDLGFDCRYFPEEPFMHAALQYMDIKAMEIVHEAGANIHLIDRNGEGPYFSALIYQPGKLGKVVDKVKWLYDHDVDWHVSEAQLPDENGNGLGEMAPFFVHAIFTEDIPGLADFLVRHHFGDVFVVKQIKQTIEREGLQGYDQYLYQAFRPQNLIRRLPSEVMEEVRTYHKWVDERADDFVNDRIPRIEMTPDDVKHFKKMGATEIFKPIHWLSHQEELLNLYVQLPDDLKLAMKEQGIDMLLTAHAAQTTIDGPATQWQTIEPHTDISHNR